MKTAARYVVTFLLTLVFIVCLHAQPATSPIEASAAQVTAGTAGAPYYVSPRRLAGGGGPGVFSSVTDTGLTSGRVVYATTGGLLATSANLLFDGTNLTLLGTTLTVPDAFALTSAGSLDFNAGGTNENVTITPSGTGAINLNATTGGVRLPSTNTAGLQLYNTADQVTNYERLVANWSVAANVATIRTESAGTGNAFRTLALGNSDAFLRITRGNRPFFTATQDSASGSVGHTFLISGINSATSGTNGALSLTPTYNQSSGTAANTDLLINRTQTAVGSGAQLLIDAQVGSTSMFNVNNLGKLTLSATNTAAGTTGNQTINKPTGTVNIAAAGTTVTVTNSLVSTSSIVFAVIRTNDATATIKNVVPGAGSFVITLGAAATAETSVGFMVIN